MTKWISQSFWLLDLMVLAMLGFFILVGAMDVRESTSLAVVVGVLALLGAAHLWMQHRRIEELSRTIESRRSRERRGF